MFYEDFNRSILYLNRPTTTRERQQSYKFIERIVSSSLPDTSYGTDGTPKKQSDVNEEVDQLASQLKKQQELSQMKVEVERAKQELLSTKCALRNVTNTERKLHETLCRRRLTTFVRGHTFYYLDHRLTES